MNNLILNTPNTQLPAMLADLASNAEALYYLDASLSDNTKKNYISDLKHFVAWGGKLPCGTMMLINYITACAEIYSINTILHKVNAIKYWHKLNKEFNPANDDYFMQIMKGIRNKKGKPVRRATAFTKNDIDFIHDVLWQRGRKIDLRDSALIQIGFYGAFRRAELVAIRIEDLNFEEAGVKIMIRRSKTDQSGIGAICTIPYSGNKICAINILKLWLEFLKAHGIESGPVFRSFMHDKKTPGGNALSGDDVANIIKNIVKDYNIGDPKTYSGHSLRRGFATSATRAGAPLDEIMKQGRWEDANTVMKYIEEADPFMRNAVYAINSHA